MRDLWHLLRARAGKPPEWPVTTVDALERCWNYRPSPPTLLTRFLRRRALTRRSTAFPRHVLLRPVTPRSRWSCAFLYLPNGQATPAHLYMVERLRARDAGLLLVCATPDPGVLPGVLAECADALIWKELEGFDFSAYSLAVQAVAAESPESDLLVVNDSVFGPFGDIDATLATMPWDLGGFTASGRPENHIQSYAFHLRSLDADRAAALAPVLSTDHAFDQYRDVIYAQETRLARIASHTMTVGALWYGSARIGDPSVHAAPSLARHGFPFLKRKLLDRDAGIHPSEALLAVLEENRHPLP